MDELQRIREVLREKLDESLGLAIALVTVIGFGKIGLKHHLAKYPAALLFVGPHIPGGASGFTKSIKGPDAEEVLERNPSAIEEMTLARFVQYWGDFLDCLLLAMISSHLTGERKYPRLGRLDVRIDFETCEGNDSIPGLLAESEIQRLSFYPHEQKLQRIMKGLDRPLAASLGSAIKKHIGVRNILEHNGGYVREEDLRRLGLEGKGLTLVDNRANEVMFAAGNRIELSYCELIQAHDDLWAAACHLVP